MPQARLIPVLQAHREPLLDYPEQAQYPEPSARYLEERARQLEHARRIGEAYRRGPEFTYSFDEQQQQQQKQHDRPFAVRPNDPRYYEEDGSGAGSCQA